jgi:Cytochrome P460
MTRKTIVIFLFGCCSLLGPAAFGADAGGAVRSPQFSGGGLLLWPDHYREWIYLTSGFDMSYNPASSMGHVFDNVFVNPEAYAAFVATGTWPDKSVLIIEVRSAESKGSINKSGNFQGSKMVGLEVHVKDRAHFGDQWAFFEFHDDTPARMIPRSAECYSCHAAHAAVDTTFVQFYPTLLPIARSKGTLSPAYRKENPLLEPK